MARQQLPALQVRAGSGPPAAMLQPGLAPAEPRLEQSPCLAQHPCTAPSPRPALHAARWAGLLPAMGLAPWGVPAAPGSSVLSRGPSLISWASREAKLPQTHRAGLVTEKEADGVGGELGLSCFTACPGRGARRGQPPRTRLRPADHSGCLWNGARGACSHPSPLASAALPQVPRYRHQHQASGAATPLRPHLKLRLLLAAAWRDF